MTTNNSSLVYTVSTTLLPSPTKGKPTSALKPHKTWHWHRGQIFFTTTFQWRIHIPPLLLHFFLPNATFEKFPPFFYILDVQMLPVLRQLEGEGKETVSSHGFGRYRRWNGDKKLSPDSHTICRQPPPAVKELMCLEILTATSSVLSKNLQKGIIQH